jgi:TatD DNase family protein
MPEPLGPLVDAHAHLDRYEPDALERALEDIERLQVLTVAVAMDPPSYAQVEAIAARSSWILPAFGVHPWHAAAWAHRLGELDKPIRQAPLIGEIGLDRRFARDPSTYPAQQAVFEHCLARAAMGGELVNLHTSGAEAEVLALLDLYRVRRPIVHWYAGPLELLEGFVDLDAYFTVGVEVASSPHIQAIARAIPDDRLLTETDNPDGLQWLGQGAGMPSALLGVLEKLAELRRTSVGELARLVRENVRRLLRTHPKLAGWLDRLGSTGPVRPAAGMIAR